MIKLTKINNRSFWVNSDLIEFIEETPDTILFLTTGKKIMVKESPSEVIDKIIIFKGKAFKNWDLIQPKNN